MTAAKEKNAVAVATGLDMDHLLSLDSDEIVEVYGEQLYPMIAPTNKDGKIKEYKPEAMKKWVDNVMPMMRQAYHRNGINGVFKILREEGLDVEVKASGKAAKAMQLEDEAQFNWSALLKWAAVGVACAVVVIGGVYFYLKYTEGKKTAGGSVVI